MIGDIEITNNGDFIKHFKGPNGKTYKKEGMYSPIVQNERHVEIIRDILKAEKYFGKSDFGIIKHVVNISNPRTVINSRYAKKEIKKHIIKHDQLIIRMKELHNANKDGHWFTEECMYKVANSLLKFNGTYTIDYKKKYGISIENKKSNENKDAAKDINLIKESSLYKELKKYRLIKSREENIKPYFLYNNLQLEALIKAKPRTIEELKSINGFADIKCEKYGADIIKIVKSNY
ncbi:MAG: HRDC domain-containing protein [Clostridium sp.]|nr:HRDC domain-containing protein [Clostridium sp.]